MIESWIMHIEKIVHLFTSFRHTAYKTIGFDNPGGLLYVYHAAGFTLLRCRSGCFLCHIVRGLGAVLHQIQESF